jgi:hypothetical protein
MSAGSTGSVRIQMSVEQLADLVADVRSGVLDDVLNEAGALT